MRVIYSPRYEVDLGPHVFPTRKYGLIHRQLLDSHVLHPFHIVEPAPASWEELAHVHTDEYLAKVRDGSLTLQELATLELPWSPGMVEGFRTMTGGTISAARMACGLDPVPQPESPVSSGVQRRSQPE